MADIYQQLKAHPQRFDFFQAVQLLEKFYQKPVGQGDEPIWFSHLPEFGFAATDVAAVTMPEAAPAALTLNFMGLFSTDGLMPAHYTEQLIGLLQDKNTALLDFIQLLEQRPSSFFYRAWKKYHCLQQEDSVNTLLKSLTGCRLTQQQNRLDIDDDFYLYYASHLMKNAATATGLEQLLSDYFSVSIRVQSLQGEWLALPDTQCSRLGQSSSAYNQLGVDMSIGSQVWQSQHKFRLLIGPLDNEQFNQFLPNGASFIALQKIVRRVIGAQLQFDVQLIVKAACVPRWQLGANPSNQLGWTSWMSSQPFENDVSDIILEEKKL